MEAQTVMPSLTDIGLDIEAAKQAMLEQSKNLTDVNDRIMDKVAVPTKFETAEYAELKTEVRQIYLIDLTESPLITEHWINGLKNMILCTDLAQYDAEEVNKGRFEKGLPDLLPDAALSLKIKTTGETKVLFIGYMDSCQAYLLLANYVASVENAKLYLDNNGTLKKVEPTNIEGLRIHI